MNRLALGLALALFSTLAPAANDPACAPYDKLRTERDQALKSKDLKRYCTALSGLMKLMPAQPPERARLACEKASAMSVETWLQVRPDVLSTMKTTFDQQCR